MQKQFLTKGKWKKFVSFFFFESVLVFSLQKLILHFSAVKYTKQYES